MKKILILVLVMSLPLVVGCNLAKDRPASFSEKSESTEKLFDDGTYAVNVGSSALYWEAFKVAGSHMGGISLKRGELIIQNGEPQSGSFLIAMNSITITDTADAGLRTNLINRLKSDDFFSVESYPTALFDITRILPCQGKGDYNFTVEGDLSLKNISQPVTILAKIRQDGKKITAEGRAEIDRTKFGIVTDQLIKDNFVLEMELSADRV